MAMTRVILLMLFLILAGLTVHAQATVEELAMKVCPIDSTAEAMILSAKGEVKVDYYATTGTVVKYYYRIKIFKKSALNKWASFNLDSRRWEVNQIKGNTYNLEGKEIIRTPLTGEAIFKSKDTRTYNNNRIALP